MIVLVKRLIEEVRNMKTMTLNGKEYVLKEDIEKEYVKKSDVETDNFSKPIVPMTDEANVLGLGSVKLGGNYQAVTVSIALLKRCISIVEQVHYSDKMTDKRDKVTLCICKDMPLCVGDIIGNDFGGAILAPRVEQ